MRDKLTNLMQNGLWFATIMIHLTVAIITTLIYLAISIITRWLGKL
jgi:hypothetical protein